VQIDEACEYQLREHLLALVDILHEPQEHAIGLEHAAAVHHRQPTVEPIAQWALEALGLLIGPMHDGFRGRPPLGAPWRALLIFWLQMSSPVGMFQMVCAIGSPADSPDSQRVRCSVARALSRQWSLLTKFTKP